MHVVIIGGGAAGFFAAIQCKIHHPSCKVSIYEKTSKFLSKVKISGGGRCNVTNIESDPNQLAKAYPRGGRQLKKMFREFNTTDTIRFFEDRGVPLVAQADGCVFPVSQDSQSIIDCFLKESNRLGIELKTNQSITQLKQNKTSNNFTLCTREHEFIADKVIVCAGGSPKLSGLQWLADLGQPIVSPLPSLFTFNMPDEPIKELMGIVVPNTLTKIAGSKLTANGPLLITHWGMSGPAIIVLSALGARELAAKNYEFEVSVNWTGENNEEKIRTYLKEIQTKAQSAQLKKFGIADLSQRLWEFLLERWGINPTMRWNELGQKNMNRIVNNLMNDVYKVRGKTTFKEEFVTAGGVDLGYIDLKTMESKVIPNLYFAGEILDMDGITGGYNFQAAWTTGYLAGKGILLLKNKDTSDD